MTHLFVVDTSAALAVGSRILKAFPDAEVIVPIAVLRELEGKRQDPLVGAAARSCLRELDSLRELGDLKVGVDNGVATVRVEINHISQTDLPDSIKNDKSTDTRILAVAKHLKATLISKDLPLRILASVVGVEAQDVPTNVRYDTALDELQTIHVDSDLIAELYEKGHAKADLDVPVNSAVILKSHDDSQSALAVQRRGWDLRLVENHQVSGVEGRSAEQTIAISHLMDKDVKVVSLGGPAGTGKTMLALAAGVEQVLSNDTRYEKIVVFRSMFAVGQQSLGFLPGTAEEKVSPWTDAIFDALSAFLPSQKVDRLKREERIEVLPITFIRGRTFNNAFIIVDEAQLLEYNVLLTLLTRVGRNTKFVLTHDVSQRDNLRVGRHDGVAAAVQRLSGDKLFAHVALRKSERSDVAEMAARLLDDGVS